MELEKIEQAKTKWLGKRIQYYEGIDSTQKEAHRLIKKSKQENGTLIITDNQTKGMGTKGRSWYCQEGKNITMTLIVYPKCLVEEMHHITKDIAQCMVEVIQELYKIELTIKEPNDLFLNGKKIAGILTQSTSLNGRVKELMIGIGFNVNQTRFEGELKEIATSLKKEHQKEHSREEIIVRFLEKLEQVLEKL